MQRRRFLKTAAGIFVPAACGIVRAQPFQLNDPALLAATVPKASGANYTATQFSVAAGNYMATASDLSGIANGKLGLFSCWVYFQSISTVRQDIFNLYNGGNPYLQVYMGGSSDYWRVKAWNASNTIIMSLYENPPSSGAWYHFICSWNMAGTWKMYINGVSSGASLTFSNDTINYASSGAQAMGRQGTGAIAMNASLSEVYFTTPASYYDLTVSANRLAFRTAGGHPADLGANGSNPTGTQPLLFLHSNYASFNTNSGSGGNFTTVGGTLSNDTNIP